MASECSDALAGNEFIASLDSCDVLEPTSLFQNFTATCKALDFCSHLAGDEAQAVLRVLRCDHNGIQLAEQISLLSARMDSPKHASLLIKVIYRCLPNYANHTGKSTTFKKYCARCSAVFARRGCVLRSSTSLRPIREAVEMGVLSC